MRERRGSSQQKNEELGHNKRDVKNTLQQRLHCRKYLNINPCFEEYWLYSENNFPQKTRAMSLPEMMVQPLKHAETD